MLGRRPEREDGDAVAQPDQAQGGERVVFSSIVFKSRAHRDRVNATATKHPLTPSAWPMAVSKILVDA